MLAAVDGRARVVAVEPVGAPTLHAALAAGGPVDVDVSGVAKDSLGARRVGAIAFEVAAAAPDLVSVLVDDADIVAARARCGARPGSPVEHGAAAAYAALTSGAYVPAAGERVATVVCGANTDPATSRRPGGGSEPHVPRGSTGCAPSYSLSVYTGRTVRA